MKKKVLIIFLLVLGLGLTACSKKMSEDEIKKVLEVNSDERTFTVKKVIYATDKTSVNGIDVKINDNQITLGDTVFNSNDLIFKQIIGYYDQVGSIYHIYMLTKDTIWEIENNATDLFDNASWINKNINNATDLILVECEEITKDMGQTPLKYQVYALVNNELVLVG